MRACRKVATLPERGEPPRDEVAAGGRARYIKAGLHLLVRFRVRGILKECGAALLEPAEKGPARARNMCLSRDPPESIEGKYC